MYCVVLVGGDGEVWLGRRVGGVRFAVLPSRT